MNDSGLLSLIYMLSGGKWPQAKIASPDHARILVSAVAVAQLVESRIVIPVVAGSSPVSHPIYTIHPSSTTSQSTNTISTKYSSVAVDITLRDPAKT